MKTAQKLKIALPLALVLLFGVITVAVAQGLWGENFDAYANGSQMHGQGGWKGWDNNAGAGALVTDAQANSSPHSVDINGGSDLVHEFSGYTSGQWTFSAWQYIPSIHSGGPTYFILLNTYNDLGPYNWSAQVWFDNSQGLVGSDFDGATLPLSTDRWVELRVEIDLDADQQDFYYDGQLLYSKSWTEGVSGGGVLNIAAVDLFANLTSTVYYDDICLAPAGADCNSATSPAGKDYLIRVRPTGGSPFTDCMHFDFDGTVIVDGLGEGMWDLTEINPDFATWLAQINGPGSLSVRFNGTTSSTDGSHLTAVALDSFGQHYAVKGKVSDSCSTAGSASGWR